MDATDLAGLREDPQKLVERRLRHPPTLESIVQGVDGLSDVGYENGLHLLGLRGNWHRLWAAIAMTFA